MFQEQASELTNVLVTDLEVSAGVAERPRLEGRQTGRVACLHVRCALAVVSPELGTFGILKIFLK